MVSQSSAGHEFNFLQSTTPYGIYKDVSANEYTYILYKLVPLNFGEILNYLLHQIDDNSYHLKRANYTLV